MSNKRGVLGRDELTSLPKNELIDIILKERRGRLNGGDTRITTGTGPSGSEKGSSSAAAASSNDKGGAQGGGSRKRKREASKKPFDMSKFHQRHIALQIAYCGQDMHGFASQEQQDINNTVETILFQALHKVCLITDRGSSFYTRCGRTDKHVSAMRQVVSLLVRSNLTEGDFLIPPSDPEQAKKRKSTKTEEMDYTAMLNNVLPPEIRVLGWSPVRAGFNARFDALHREYKYYFLRGSLDVERMREAAQSFIGEHDFSNFCKMDVINVSNYVRVMLSVSLEPAEVQGATGCPQPDSPEQLYVLRLSGYAFLWHQVRCMMAVLFMVGEHKESPDIVKKLLDVETLPGRPAYRPALPHPLLLYDCGFEDLTFTRTPSSQLQLLNSLKHQWAELQYRAAIVRDTIQYVEKENPGIGQEEGAHRQYALSKREERVYIPLLERDTRDSYDSRVAALQSKGKTVKEKQG